MADWSYSGDPSTSVLDEVRFWLQDTDEGRPLLMDAELTYLIGRATPIWQSAVATAALACDVLVAKFASEVSISGDGDNIALEQLQDKFTSLSQSLRKTFVTLDRAGGVPIAFGIDTFEMPTFGVKPLDFGIGMHDNIRAGRQDYGTERYEGYEIPESGYWTS